MKWRLGRKRVQRDLEEARQGRIESERRLAEAEQDVIVPLRELRESNHIRPLLRTLIERKIEQKGDGK